MAIPTAGVMVPYVAEGAHECQSFVQVTQLARNQGHSQLSTRQISQSFWVALAASHASTETALCLSILVQTSSA